ncbi:MAG TPA: hemerythrin domain-containing protein [Nitrospirales bacterium]|nr:hemerythrin domain-containing protein [Nitrospirales bacterium]
MVTKTQKAQAAQVTDMLRKDHKKVKGLFRKFEKTDNAREKQEIVDMVVTELEIHAELEEKIIYPAVRSKMNDEDLMDEAIEEHHVVHGVIGELKKMKPGDQRYDAKVTVLGELCKHHIQEEEEEMLPKAEKRDIDWDGLHQQVMKRKDQLMEKAGLSSNGASTNSKARKKK